ncbi:Magnesium transport protein CorA [Clavibacter michiganensis subsp. michiganensis]|uniref:Magnesium transport protein CorA n=1 Tax=Clavibacter michiganensis subsp. michiganensis TaxID=33013 RepID=A0A251XJX2_CLAMM|nr:Magnesium transport protein CorA [Clavibacter michiganensis subsp. michiganensis]OUE03747.1 Magnesium transport protein CorA [Clavibacter michiganensis subsp. michiganensis]
MSQHRIRTRLKSVVSRGVAPLGGHAGGASRARAEREDPAERSGARRPSLVDNGVYVDGCRVASPATLADTFRELDERPDAMAWIGLYRPTVEELQALAEEFDLHELAVEDAVQAHQRPKTERYSSTLFTVLRAARYVDDREEVEFGELHVFLGRNFVITVRHAESPDLSAIRTRMQERPELLSHGPQSVLYAILDAVVDGYAPVVTGLANDIDEIEDQVFDGDPAVSRRIYELSREVIDFQRAVRRSAACCSSCRRDPASTRSARTSSRRSATWPTTSSS